MCYTGDFNALTRKKKESVKYRTWLFTACLLFPVLFSVTKRPQSNAQKNSSYLVLIE